MSAQSWGCKKLRAGAGWTGYLTANDAATGASNVIANLYGNELQKKEFWYWIYSYPDPIDGKIKYGYTSMYKGNEKEVTEKAIDCATEEIPSDGIREAGGHTHPAGGGEDFSGLPGDRGHYPNGNDYLWVNGNNFPVYLLTATGKVRLLKPRESSSHYVGSVRVIIRK